MVYDGITRQQILDLAKSEANTAVTIYLPTPRAGIDVTQGRIKLKNMLAEAVEELTKLGMRHTLAIDFVAKAAGLDNDPDFWNDRLDSVALFIGAETFEVFHLPFSTIEMLEVGSHFNIRPLMPSLNWRIGYYVLCLDKNGVRLLHCGPRRATEVEVPDMPKSFESFFALDHAERGYQRYSAGGPGRTGTSITHGSGDRSAEGKERDHLFLAAIARAVEAKLSGSLEPLILVGAKDLQDGYRHASKLSHLVEEGIVQSPKPLNNADLLRMASKIVRAYDDSQRKAALAHYSEMAGTGFTSQQIEEIVPAAVNGRVDVLLAQMDGAIWGCFDSGGHAVVHSEPLDGDEELINEAAIKTLENSGTVYTFDPSELSLPEPVGAIFRY